MIVISFSINTAEKYIGDNTKKGQELRFEGYFLDIRSFTYCSIRDLVGKLSTSVYLTKHDQPAISHIYFIRIDAYNTVMPVIEQVFLE